MLGLYLFKDDFLLFSTPDRPEHLRSGLIAVQIFIRMRR